MNKLMNKLWIVLIVALTGCNMTKPESPQQIVAKCNTVTAGESVDPGVACYQAEKTLPTAIQFGDSVSLGYGVMARHDLCGVVDYRHDAWDTGDINLCGESYNPYDRGVAILAASNNGYSTTMLSDMEAQLNGKHFNVMLFNTGYHDIEHGIPESVYRDNLEAMAQMCEQRADICIWVQTPGLDAASLPLGPTMIEAGSVSQYNTIARGVARRHGFYILNLPATNHDGTIHLTGEGYEAAGIIVASCVITAIAGEYTPDCHK